MIRSLTGGPWVDAVHAKGATMLLQLWHAGRTSHGELQRDGDQPLAPSAIESGVGTVLEGRLRRGNSAAGDRDRGDPLDRGAISARRRARKGRRFRWRGDPRRQWLSHRRIPAGRL